VILMHPPGPVSFRHFKLHTHMSSDLPGEAGTQELLDFGRRIGLRESWLQHPGEPKEHFDVFDGAITRARAAGAQEVHHAEFIRRVVQAKRAASTPSTPEAA
jgi:hypothetical protein